MIGRMMGALGGGLAAVLAVALAAGGGAQSALAPAGPQAARIAGVWWLFFWVSTAVWVAVMIALGLALVRGARRRRREGSFLSQRPRRPQDAEPGFERSARGVVAAAIAVTVVLLFVLLVDSVAAGRSLSRLGEGDIQDPLTVQIIGHQWWWEVNYLDPDPSRSFTTANEIHLPVGRPVKVVTVSHDVIHSLWIPNLHGKRDLIPGHPSTFWLQADRAGVFRGQCAEFCGYQHANMALVVVAEPAAGYESWAAGERQPAPPPASPAAVHGQQVFMQGACPLCHSIQGTGAGGHLAPDLTHLAARRTLAAATLPNSRGHLAGWIVDPQSAKPGSLMPATSLPPSDLQDLLAYLEELR